MSNEDCIPRASRSWVKQVQLLNAVCRRLLWRANSLQMVMLGSPKEPLCFGIQVLREPSATCKQREMVIWSHRALNMLLAKTFFFFFSPLWTPS